MKYVFAGGMTISAELLETLCRSGHHPECAFGYPASLSHRSNYRALDTVAKRFGFPLTHTQNINATIVEKTLAEIRPDWFLVFGWSQLVKASLLSIPKFGTLGFHMTKLPEGRGRAPIAWTLVKGMTEGAVTLLWLDPGVDSGPIAAQRGFAISVLDDAEVAVGKVNRIACDLILQVLPQMKNGSLPRIQQDEAAASHWPKRSPKDGEIDWTLDISSIYNLIRGIARPFPGAFTHIDGTRVNVWRSGLVRISHSYPSGQILGPYVMPGVSAEAGIVVTAKDGFLILREVDIMGTATSSPEDILALASRWTGRKFAMIGT